MTAAIENAKKFPLNTRVAPKDTETAEVLANRKYYAPGEGVKINHNIPVPAEGEVVGYAGDYVLVLWSNSRNGLDTAVHPLNLRTV